MHIYNSTIFEVDAKETRRYAGLMKADFDESKIEAACTEAMLLIEPKGCWNIYDYDSASQTVYSNPSFAIIGKKIGKHLENCQKVVVLAATVGEAIEEQITRGFNEGRYSASVLLDAAATAAVEQVADNMEKAIKNAVSTKGLSMRWRFSPGYGDWPIEQQPEILQAAGGKMIGVSLSDSMMLMPRKSITAIIGLYHNELLCTYKSYSKHNCYGCNKVDCLARRI